MKIFYRLLLPAIIVILMASDANAAQSVNVEQYLNLVRIQNHSLLAAAKNVEAAYYQVLASVGYQRLRAGINVNANYNTVQQSAGGNTYNPVGYSITPSISQTIDISGVFKLSERQSILGYESTRVAFDNSINNILASAEDAYWGVVMARDNVNLQRDILRQRQENLRVTEEKYNQQLVPKLDVIRATSSVSDAQNSIVNAEGTLLNRLAVLRNYAGGVFIEPSVTNFYVPELSISVNDAVAIENHPSVRQRRILLAQSEVQKQIAQKGMAPTLGASANWNLLYGTSAGSSMERGDNVSVGLSLNIPISDGNQTKYETFSRSAATLAAMEDLIESEASVILNLTVALNDWYMAKSLEENMKQQVERSNEELKITELMYNEGMGSQLDLITAQTDNQAVRTNYINAVMGMYSAIVSLRQAMGDYAPAVEGTWKDALVKYGVKKGEKSVDKNNDNVEILPQNEEIFINVRGIDIPLSSAIEWLRGGAEPSELQGSSSINMPLSKKNPDGTYEAVKFNGGKEISLEEALDWLDK
ncbi:MAG: TolC family protein [Synergistaceae bacterium]|nr:TolC family protein [Synergistaceae bacterium]